MKLPMNYEEKINDLLDLTNNYIKSDKRDVVARKIKYQVSLLNEAPEGRFIDLSVIKEMKLDALRIAGGILGDDVSGLVREKAEKIKHQIDFSEKFEKLTEVINYQIISDKAIPVPYKTVTQVSQLLQDLIDSAEGIPGCDVQTLVNAGDNFSGSMRGIEEAYTDSNEETKKTVENLYNSNLGNLYDATEDFCKENEDLIIFDGSIVGVEDSQELSV